MKRMLLLALALLLGLSPATAQNYTATQGAGTTFGSKLVTAVNYPQIVFCDPATPAQCVGVNASGQMTIANTTFAATQSGAWTVNPTTIGNWGLSASTYNTATPANAMLIEGQFLTAPGAMTSGNSAPLQIDGNGNLRVNVMTGGGAGGTSSSFGSAFPGTGTAIGLSNGTNMVPWSATTNYGTAPAAIPVPAVNAYVSNALNPGRAVSGSSSPVVPSAAPTTFHLIAAASTNATSVKASAATLMSCQTSNNSTTPAYLKIYNKASAPTVGTDVPVFTGIIPGPAAGGGGSNIEFGPGGVTLGTGFALAVTGVITDADATAVAATTFAINCQYE